MKVIVVGTGTIGQAVRDVLIDRGDEVISVGRTCGDRQADVTDIAFPGFTPVPAHEVAQAYVRAISNPGTGRIIKLHKTNS
jgi:nucleoside-diphosphate-sugar epimerase